MNIEKQFKKEKIKIINDYKNKLLNSMSLNWTESSLIKSIAENIINKIEKG